MDKSGWLQDPVRKWIMRFHRDPRSWILYPYVFVDKGRFMLDGSPPLIKSRRYLAIREAIELWRQLLQDGWKRVPPQW